MFFNILAFSCQDVPDALVNVVHTLYTLIKVAIPLVLILMGMLDLGRAVISQKEDDIKKNQSIFVKRLVAAALVFFVLAIVELLVGIVAGSQSEKDTITKCINMFLK